MSTWIDVACAMTWLFVSTRPDDEITWPVPAASPPPSSVVVTFTIAGVTLAAMLDTSELPLELLLSSGCVAKPAVGEDDDDEDASCRPIPTPMLAIRPTTSAATKRDLRFRWGGSPGGGAAGNPYCGGAGGRGGGLDG